MKTEAAEGYWSLVEPLWDPLTEAWESGPEAFVRQFGSIGSDAKYLYAAHWCISEVDNGGLLQFFWNSTGILAPEAVKGFELVGLTDLAQILQEAMRHFGEAYPRERSERVAPLPDWPRGERSKWDPFHTLDDRFYDHSTKWEVAANAFALRIRQAPAG
jgi:hypothetical protein